MMELRMMDILYFLLVLSLKLWELCTGKQVLADVTSNKLTRQHDGSFGLWSFHGVAKESHASKTSFIYNADLLTADGSNHVNIASTVYPALGLTSDQDPIYQEYLILQAKVVGIDGFMIEWGYKNHSSDIALRSYLKLAQNYAPFQLAVNWCDHWLMVELRNKSSQEVIETFHSNLQYLMDTLYSTHLSLYHNANPVIFLFGGGLTSAQFKTLLSLPLTLPPGAKPPLWIGSFLNFAATPDLWAEWCDLLNGTFGWAPDGMRPTPSNMSEWDLYGTVDDAVQYQRNLSEFGENCLTAGKCVLWCGSASPGFDNRGCAGWGRKLRYIPRLDIHNQSRSTYDVQWEYHINSHTSAEYIVIPTMNDFPEATPILELNSTLPSSLYSTMLYASQWKGHQYDVRGLELCPVWYQLYKEMQFYNMTPGIDVEFVEDSLQAAKLLISQGTPASLSKASIYIQNARDYLSKIKANIKEEIIVIPVPSSVMFFSYPPVIEDGSYIINNTSHLYLHLVEKTASVLRESIFKGLLSFQYQALTQDFGYIRVVSSSKTHGSDSYHKYAYHSKGLVEETKPERRSLKYTVELDRSEVCKIHLNGTGNGMWYNGTVAMYKENQSWDHTALHASDLVFIAEGSYAIRNISLQFTTFSKR